MDLYDGWNRGWGFHRNGDRTAAAYFDSLPLEVKEMLNRHVNEITSVEKLRKIGNQMENKLEAKNDSSKR